jgi:hypothetical protein
MSGKSVKVTKKGPGIDKIKADMQAIARMDVLVGVPQTGSSRPGDPINNAELVFIHTHGIRQKAMREEMQPELDKGTPYSAAHQMYIQEHGSPLWQSPPRPIIEPAIADETNKQRISQQLAQAAKLVMEGKGEQAKQQLRRVGMLGQNIVREWFTNPKNDWPPNSPKTIAAKGSDRPLIDTGEMRKSITYVVRGDNRD